MIKINKTKILGVLLAFCLFVGGVSSVSAATTEVLAGGVPFGIKLYTDGLIVMGFSPVESEGGSISPAADAGIQEGDVITRVSGVKVSSAEEFVSLIEDCSDSIEITFKRGDTEMSAVVTPAKSMKDNKYKTGMWLRDSTAGIGTVTYVDPDTHEFGGLGHGICDAESGQLIPLLRGIVADVQVSGVKKGECGSPGELHGYFTTGNCGVILKNTTRGVFGMLSASFEEIFSSERIPLGTRSDVKMGNATILSTVDGGGRGEYSIKITRLPDKDSSQSFEIEVTDSALIEKTGGIVQGMSGSPILQNGKLVGAVTHVLVNDPTRGYGIFIESMLDAAA